MGQLFSYERYLLFILINKHFIEIIYYNYSNTQMKVYAKDSFDRFDDGLAEEILQYLTFEYKVHFERVSKQWRKVIYNKQFVINFNKNNNNLHPHNLRRLVRNRGTTEAGNGNRGGRGYFEIPPPGRKILENTPPLEILGKYFEKPGKTEKIR